MFLVCLDLRSDTLKAIEASQIFAINFLGQGGGEACKIFSGKSSDKFAKVPNENGMYGLPILEAAIAHVECVLHQAHLAGDHKILIGAAVAGSVSDGEPLAYFRGGFHRLDS